MKKSKLNIDKLANTFIEKALSLPKIKVAVVHPCNEDALKGAVEAAKMGLIDPILVGPIKKIKNIAKKEDLHITKYELIDVPHSNSAAECGVSLVRQGKVDALMKGSLHTDELMSEVLKKETGLRTGRRISHAFIMASDHYHKPFIVTDAAINISPDLLTKKDIVQNAIDLAVILLGKKTIPKVAILSAIETVNPAIVSTLDAACLSKMADRGQITGGIVDGPFAYDNVISIHAARTKHIKSLVVGDADIFVVPDIESGNILAKSLVLMSDAISAGIILGAHAPIILTSRSDGTRSRIASCVIAVLMVHDKKRRLST